MSEKTRLQESGIFVVTSRGIDLPSAGPGFSYLKLSFKSEKSSCELPLAVLTRLRQSRRNTLKNNQIKSPSLWLELLIW